VEYGKKLAELAIKAAQTRQRAGQKVEKKKVLSVQMITKKNVEQTDISRWQ
jgi:ribose transport system substrate-binding protein